MATWKKLEVFWKRATCPVKMELRVCSAVARAKFMYGLESAQVNESVEAQLDVFQLKGIRQILKTTVPHL